MKKIAVIGLGYVGLPLAIEFAKKNRVIGFDICNKRVKELSSCQDNTKEADLDSMKIVMENYKKDSSKGLYFSNNINDIADCNIYIVAVPTPIDHFYSPDLKPLISASEMIGSVVSKGDIIVYESTTYPGCTEEECVPAIEKISGLKFNKDFFVGYSPERINPGDKVQTLTKIKKVTSGSTPEIAEEIDQLYKSIIEAGTHKAPSIKVAEASKIVENTQRDINISFMNELAFIFDKIGIDTRDVIEAAGTKWNFLKYTPGLVGGHCISVDPYYLAKKSEILGYIPQVILSGRNVNNAVSSFIANKVMRLMIQKGSQITNSNVLILGISFKENCPDIRNTKVVDIYNELQRFNVNVDVYDNWVNKDNVYKEYGIKLIDKIDDNKKYSAIIMAVSHDDFKEFNFKKYHDEGSVIFDVKSVVDRKFVDSRL